MTPRLPTLHDDGHTSKITLADGTRLYVRTPDHDRDTRIAALLRIADLRDETAVAS